MALDIRGSLKNTKINKNQYVVIDELLSNSVDSFLIRKNKETNNEDLKVSFLVEFFDKGLKEIKGNSLDLKITCTDNGYGFRARQTKAFVTKDTTYKDDLGIEGIGQCRGTGRVQFLHYFTKLKINSVYSVGDNLEQRQLSIDETTKEIKEKSFDVKKLKEGKIGTSITLDFIRPETYELFLAEKNLETLFSAESLKYHVMTSFLQLFVSLENYLGNFSIQFKTRHNDIEEEITLNPSDLPKITETKKLTIFPKNDKGLRKENGQKFTISHYRLNKDEYKLKSNAIALCAKSAIVKFISDRYLKPKKRRNNDINGFYHIILIESDYLDQRVNPHRDNFRIPKNSQDNDIFSPISLFMDDIYEAIDEEIHNMLALPDWNKNEVLRKIGIKYGISAEMIAETNVRIILGDTEDSVVKRVLTSYQEKIIKDTSEIFDIKEEISKAEPNSDDFRQKVNDLSWKYTSSIRSIDMANLSQIVVRRAAILEILNLAVNKNLAVQNVDDGKKKQNEKLIHNIFFPMGKDSNELRDHDMWLLSEEYHYYDYIASDRALSKLNWNDGKPLFSNDIDEELDNILRKNYGDNKLKRPDIALFNKEGSVVIIEFKAPDVDMEKHIGDLMEYAVLLAAKSNGKLKKFYGYLIGDKVNENRIRGFTKFPDSQGWFGTEEVIEHSTNTRLGELYSEILFYDDVVSRANKRLEVYKKRLGVELN